MKHIDSKLSLHTDPASPLIQMISTNIIGVTYTTYLAMHYFRVLALNLNTGPLPPFKRTILFMSSLAAYRNIPGWADYSMAHFAVRGLFKSMRYVVQKWGIRMNSLAPS
jgi:5'-hydroxyaverantin dehydrogenase